MAISAAFSNIFLAETAPLVTTAGPPPVTNPNAKTLTVAQATAMANWMATFAADNPSGLPNFQYSASFWLEGTPPYGNSSTGLIGNYDTLVTAYKNAAKGGAAPGGNPYYDPTGIGTAAQGDVSGAISAADAVPHFLSLLSDSNTWVRVGEFIAGLLLVGVAAHAALGGNPGYQQVASKVKTGAKTAGLVAAA